MSMNNEIETISSTSIPDAPSTPKLLLQHGYQYIELIGEGANGKTYKANNLKTSEIVAIKELKFSENLKNYELFEREAQTLKSIHTPGTPRFYEYITSEKEFTECWLVQEYVDGESVLDKLENGQTFGEVETLQLMLQTADIVRMLQTMYSPPIIHRDIKPSNILIRNMAKDGMTCCLIDFGAVANPQRRGLNSTVAGTVGYMAPEQLLGDCTIQSDYYAIGASALHIMTGIPPSNFVSDGFKLHFEEQLKNTVPGIHKETIELLRKLLSPNAQERPQNGDDLLRLVHETLKTADDKVLIREQIQNKIRSLETYIDDSSDPYKPTFFTLFLFVIYIIFSIIISSTITFSFQSYSARFILLIICLIFLIAIPLVLYSVCERKLLKLNIGFSKLPNYDDTPKLEYKPKIVDVKNSFDDTGDAIGIVQAVFRDVVEYTITKDHNTYTGFIDQSYKKYKPGDQIKINDT